MGRQKSWSTATIMIVIAASAASIAGTFPALIASAMYEPTPGSRKSLSPSVNASLTVRKNHPPAMDIMEFHTSPIMLAGTSRMRKTRFGRQAVDDGAASRRGVGMLLRLAKKLKVMFQTWPVKIMMMQAISSPIWRVGKSAIIPSTSPGRKPRTGMD